MSLIMSHDDMHRISEINLNYRGIKMKSSVVYLEPINGSRPIEVFIGKVRTTENKEHKISYETASWYTLVDVPAGEYDVVIHTHLGMSWVLVKYKGIITKEHFENRLFTSSSIREPTENIGTERSCIAQMYDYIAAEQFATNPLWELVEDWTIHINERYSELLDGFYASFRLVKRG